MWPIPGESKLEPSPISHHLLYGLSRLESLSTRHNRPRAWYHPLHSKHTEIIKTSLLETCLPTHRSFSWKPHIPHCSPHFLCLLIGPGASPSGPVPRELWAIKTKTSFHVCMSYHSWLKWSLWVKSLSCVRFSATPWTVAYQAPPSMGFSRQEYWSGLPFPSPGKWSLDALKTCYT